MAAPRGVFNVLPGFQVERLYTVPKGELGSWVCITTDDKGRLIVSDQYGGLYRSGSHIATAMPTEKVAHLVPQDEGQFLTAHEIHSG